MSEWPDRLNLQPILAWPTEKTRNRKLSQFSAPLRTTLKELDRELAAIHAKDVVMQIALERGQFRNDGYPRAHAVPEHPGIILTMSTADGALSFPCDTFVTWQENLRAITLTMQKFRDIARYGVTKNGQQYAGFRAIEAPAPADRPFTDAAVAQAFLCRFVPESDQTEMSLAQIARRARADTHPDRGGKVSDYHRVVEAIDFLTEAGLI